MRKQGIVDFKWKSPYFTLQNAGSLIIDVLRKSQKTQDNKYDQLESRFSPKQEKAEVHATGGQATENSYGLQ